MDTQRVHHTDNSYPFNRIGTNARAIVNCSLKNRRTRVESNKPGATPKCYVKLTASNRVVSACHCRTNTDRSRSHVCQLAPTHIACESNVLCLAVLYRTVPGLLRRAADRLAARGQRWHVQKSAIICAQSTIMRVVTSPPQLLPPPLSDRNAHSHGTCRSGSAGPSSFCTRRVATKPLSRSTFPATYALFTTGWRTTSSTVT